MSRGRRESYLTTETIPLPYCPGCGHKTLVEALDAALVRLQPDPREVVIVTDIGCIGLADRNFTTSAFHGLHGRSITYACGLKLARPELRVITVMGDGACGIGGTHLLNVARRNIGITLLVANNMNYGMTGGQHSLTTPLDGLTATTPAGNLESPIDICATAAAAGASWVHRATTFDRDLDSVIAAAIQEPGFAMVEAWELCTAYYAPRNELHRSDLLALLDELGFRRGRLVDTPRPEFSVRYREAAAALGRHDAGHAIDVAHANSVARQTGFLLGGAAGQKIKSAATLFGRAAIASGLDATQKDDYPITVKTGHSLAELIVSREPIEYAGIDVPDWVLLLAPEGVRRTQERLMVLPAATVVLADETLGLPETRAQVRRYPFLKTAKRVGRLSVAAISLATLLEESGVFPLAALRDSVRTTQTPEVARTSLAALEAGAELARR